MGWMASVEGTLRAVSFSGERSRVLGRWSYRLHVPARLGLFDEQQLIVRHSESFATSRLVFAIRVLTSIGRLVTVIGDQRQARPA
jgi:hypothetical protein